MRCYNAEMSKPFQFSMLRMMVAIALFCCSAWLFASPFRYGVRRGLDVAFLFILAGSFGGGAIGTLFRRTAIGVIAGFLLILLAASVVVVMVMQGIH
jgi:hypothetical protein